MFGYAHTASFKKHQLIGLGASAIGRMPQGFVQNVVATRDYLARIAEDRLTTAKGYSFMLVHFDPAAGSPKPRKSKGRSDQKHDLAGNDGFMAVHRRVCHTKVNCEDREGLLRRVALLRLRAGTRLRRIAKPRVATCCAGATPSRVVRSTEFV
ncbi:hypothetical protein ACVWZZ_001440 [Bradyrhizobium sp. LM6.10]